IAIGLPFLLRYPIEYIKSSFNLGRVFLYQWTVNWRFLPEEIFLDRRFHILLILCHLAAILVVSNFEVTNREAIRSLRFDNWEHRAYPFKTST
ncbi:ALG3 protein-like protein, partial [Dinothrombium tinctorium]